MSRCPLSATQTKKKAEFPKKLEFLFRPARYKGAHGGRGSGKSWSFARALLIQGASQKLRILCTREVQKSIKDSVHKLLSDQISALGLSSFYQVLETQIRGKNGTEFVFAGLSNQTAESIKSLEGIDRCWCEEGQGISKRSWDILIPTIRKESSEIWISMNPELDSDDTYVRFIENQPEDSFVVQVNYTDNPWFSPVLEQERLHALASMSSDDYANIWEGRCRRAAAGAIYAGEIETAVAEGRIRNLPHDPMHVVHCVWDLGWNDSMTIIMVQKIASELRVVNYIEDSHKTLDWYVAQMDKMPYRFGQDWLPHDGEHKDFKTGKSAKEILEALGRKEVKITPNVSVEEGIRTARMTFPRVYFDQEKTARLLNCLKRYRRSINKQTMEPGAPLHDEFSHGADAYRYLGLVADQMVNPADAYNHGLLNSSIAQIGNRPASRAGY